MYALTALKRVIDTTVEYTVHTTILWKRFIKVFMM